jgi:diacylglycerol kinase (ATP)
MLNIRKTYLMKGRTGLNRLLHAFLSSCQGINQTWRSEAAFRQELMLVLVLLSVALLLDVSRVERVLLIGTLLLVLIVELLNTGIEAVVDLVSPQYSELAGKAKDAASAAVLLSLVLTAYVWGAVIF